MPQRREPSGAIHHQVRVSVLPRDGMPVHFEASAAEREALARQLAIPAVETMTADLTVRPWRGDGVRVDGTLRADVVQECVVTLNPVRQTVEEPVDLLYVPETSRLAPMVAPDTRELQIDPEGEDAPEIFSGDRIDIGSVLAEILALGLDPYPRAANVGFDGLDTDPSPEPERVSPFAVLRRRPGTDFPHDK